MTKTRVPHYESEAYKELREYLRGHATGYCQREHTGVSDSGYGFHLEIWTNKHSVFPVMLTAWEQPNGEWYCQLWDGEPFEFPQDEDEKTAALRKEAEALEKKIESMDKDVEYLQRHGSGKAHAEARHKRHRAHQKLTDIYKQLNKE